jgi:FkbH-like protein
MKSVLEYPFDAQYILSKRKRIKKELLASCSGFMEKRIAVLGGSTTHDIKDILELFLLSYGIKPEFYESEYNQYWEDAVFGNEELDQFHPDLVFIHTSNRNITQYPSVHDQAEYIDQLIDQQYQKFETMWEKIAEKYSCPIIQNNFEYPFYRLLGNKDASDIHGRVHFITKLNMKWYEYAQTHPNFFIHDINYLSADYGLEAWSDPFYWHMYKYALCLPAIPRFAYSVANIIKSIYGKNKKAFALDLDQTLWGGIVGDDGVDNIEIGNETSLGQVYSEFQEYLKAHKELGILLNVVSKNEEENALAGLNHPDGILKPEDFIEIKANWEPKSQNLMTIAHDLTLLPESFVFVDDNPAEREIIRQQVPGTAVPELDKVEHYINVIDRAGYFEVTNFSQEDLKRNEMYKENAERRKLEVSFDNYSDYLRSLDMHANINSFEEIHLSRIAQLTNKSNQFNLTTKRYTQEEIEAVAKSDEYIDLSGRLMDKFGDNGIVSVVIGKIDGQTIHMDLWIMSCRVLKRDMEYAMMDELVACCQERGIHTILGYYYPTAKNKMVKDFYEKQGFTKESEDEQGNTVWRFDIPEHYQKKNTVIDL